MINTAWAGDKVSGDALKPFMQTKKLLKNNANARDIVVSYENFNRIIDALPRHARHVVQAAFYTGMRRGEIMGLTWGRVDMKNRIITLERENTKTDQKRIIPICDELHNILEGIPREMVKDEYGKTALSPYVFVYKKLPMKSIRASLRNACEKCGIPYGRNTKGGITFHDLRHTFTTLMRKAGAHDTVIMGITGHKTREMFDRYNAIDEAEKESAVKAFSRSLVDRNVDQKKKGNE